MNTYTEEDKENAAEEWIDKYQRRTGSTREQAEELLRRLYLEGKYPC